MTSRILTLVFVVAASSVAHGQSGLLTPHGAPDLQGPWDFSTLTPFERPGNLEGQEFFTREDAEEYLRATLDRGDMDRRDGPSVRDVERAYNDFWWDRGESLVWTLRTSLVIDPPDGQVPPMNAEGRARQAERREANLGHEFDGPENRPLPERCLILQGAGPPMTPTAYNNNVQIVQSPGYVAILIEMGHEVRIIPTSDQPHLPDHVQQWKGDSRGRWEGDTLVVETTNLSGKNPFRGSSPGAKLIERFRRVDADRLIYQFTIEDPATWDIPWTVEIPVRKSEGAVYEYACHEGNYGMAGVLRGARQAEREAAGQP